MASSGSLDLYLAPAGASSDGEVDCLLDAPQAGCLYIIRVVAI
jgi:hypothetical protein